MSENTNDCAIIAAQVLAAAATFDEKLAGIMAGETDQQFAFRIQMWSEVIAMGPYPRLNECLAAVRKHYATSDYPIKPVAIVEYLKTVGVDSSNERFRDWLYDHATKYPRSRQIAVKSGLEQPYFDHLSREEATREFVKWIQDHEDELLGRCVGKLQARQDEIRRELEAVYDPYGESHKPDLEGLE
ncbi:hypothetical protein SEA_JONJAMES_119 [Gordonia Phage JonJames]|nr:hypothetical protein SEA_JONJAMES_119 [Gordonia Phage JonJames]